MFSVRRIGLAIVLAGSLLATADCAPAAPKGVPDYGYVIVHAYPHDTGAFTEGLFYLNGCLYESTGLEGRSSVRRVELATGAVVEKRDLPPAYFGEGIVNWKDRLIQLTYQSQIGFIYDLATFKPEGDFHYVGEGWGLTQDGVHIIMSDGTAFIRFLDPETLKEVSRIAVTDRGQPVRNINELEWVKGEILANIWQTNQIARIDPKTGQVIGWIDLEGLSAGAARPDDVDAVLNGIAYDAKTDRLFVTGKTWSKLYEIRLTPKPAAP